MGVPRDTSGVHPPVRQPSASLPPAVSGACRVGSHRDVQPMTQGARIGHGTAQHVLHALERLVTAARGKLPPLVPLRRAAATGGEPMARGRAAPQAHTAPMRRPISAPYPVHPWTSSRASAGTDVSTGLGIHRPRRTERDPTEGSQTITAPGVCETSGGGGLMVPAAAPRVDRLTRAANLIVGGSGGCCLLLVLYYVYHYLWTGKRVVTGPVGLVVYGGLPAVLAALLFASLRLRPLPRISCALVLVSVVAATFAANVFCVLGEWSSRESKRTLWLTASDVPALVKVAKTHNVTFDTRTKREVIQDLQRRGIDAVPSIVPLELMPVQADGTRKSVLTLAGTEVLPHGGISHTVTVFCNESGAYEWYTSDEHGFHNPPGLWRAAPLEVVAVGDSFAQGHCVASTANFVSRIRRQYPRTVNLGINGQGPLMTLATLRDYGPSLQPQVVLWFFFEGNDLTELAQEQHSPLLRRYLQSDFRQPLLQWQTEIDQALAAFLHARMAAVQPAGPPQEAFSTQLRRALVLLEELVTLGPLRDRLGLAYGAYRHAEDPSAQALMDVFEHALREGKKAVESWGGRLYFVYLPDRDRYVRPPGARSSRAHVLRIVQNLGMRLIDLDHAFRAHPDPLALFPFRRLGHYNEAGHRLVAEAVLSMLTLGQ